MTKKSQEVAVIDFEKFSVAQLPELQGKKEEIKGIIEANPVVDIIDNSTYELAKKSRTAVKSLCTGLEGEQKTVKKRIKEFVLDAVDKEYDTLVLGARSALKERQEPITAWEDKKEQERLEKVRLEELRIDNIKSSIRKFREEWDDVIFMLTFDKIEDIRADYSVDVLEFDRSKLAEFEVLFDDAVVYLDNLFANKIKTLTEQEEIRLEQIRLAEERKKQEEEAKKIAEAQRVEREKFEAEQKAIAEKQRIAQEKFQKEKAEFEAKQLEAKYQERKKFLVDEDYWRIYLLAECGEREEVAKAKLLNFSDLDFEDFKLAVLKAKEPKEEVKLQYVDPKDTLPLGTTDKIDEIANNDAFVYTEQIAQAIEDKMTEDRNAPIPTEVRGVFTDEIAQEQSERVYKSEPIASSIQNVEGNRIVQADYHEEDVHEVATAKKIDSVENWTEQGRLIEKDGVLFDTHLNEVFNPNNLGLVVKETISASGSPLFDVKEVTWEEIHDTFVENTEIDDSINFFYWLKENYNVPTKKQ